MIELLKTLAREGGPAGLVIVVLVVFGLAFMVLLVLGICRTAARPMPEDTPWLKRPDAAGALGVADAVEKSRESTPLWLDEERERRR